MRFAVALSLLARRTAREPFPWLTNRRSSRWGSSCNKLCGAERIPCRKCKPTGDKSADEELWTQTLGEVEQGWIDGPYWDEHGVSDRLGTDDWMNSAYATYNKLRLNGCRRFHFLGSFDCEVLSPDGKPDHA